MQKDHLKVKDLSVTVDYICSALHIPSRCQIQFLEIPLCKNTRLGIKDDVHKITKKANLGRISVCLKLIFLSMVGESPLWMVPVSISTASSPSTAVNRFVLKDKQTTVTLENVKPDEWVKVSSNFKRNPSV